MRTFSRGRADIVVGSLFVIFLVAVFIVGCKKDDSNPVLPGTGGYPSVAGHWVGTLEVVFFPGTGGTVDWAVEADITQDNNRLAHNWVYTVTFPALYSGERTSAKGTGTITMARQVSLAETSWVALNWSGANWGLSSYKGVLSAKGDTLSGRDTSAAMVIDSWLLVKK